MQHMSLRRLCSFLAVLALLTGLFSCLELPKASAEVWSVSPTGYTSADDVQYVISGGYVTNWGARGETATFLTNYAREYYTGNYTYARLSAYSGGTSQDNAPSSALYSALNSMLSA